MNHEHYPDQMTINDDSPEVGSFKRWRSRGHPSSLSTDYRV